MREQGFFWQFKARRSIEYQAHGGILLVAAIQTMKRADKQKEPAALIFSNTAGSKIGAKNHLLKPTVFFFPRWTGQALVVYWNKKRTDNHKWIYLVYYRLCVCASGSWMIDKFSFLIVIRVSCLHLGQYNGKFSSTVSSRIFNRVLLPQKGHKIHSIFILSSSVLSFLLFLPYGKLTVFLSFFLLTALGFPFQLTLFMLEFQGLLCLCANAFILQLTLNFALHSFGIDFSLYDYFDLDRGTEFQFMPILQQKIIDLILYLILFSISRH